MYAAISQLTFDHATKNAIYAAYPELYPKGADPLQPSADNIFADGYTYQLATLEPNPDTRGYRAALEVTVQGEGTLGVGYLEQQAAEHILLEQNIPNPATGATTIPLEVRSPSHVRLELWSVHGIRIATLFDSFLPEGRYAVDVDRAALGLAPGNYVYQLTAQNAHGRFSDCKVLTVSQ